MASQILPHNRTHNQTDEGCGRILNICRVNGRWYVELAALDRLDYMRRRGGGRVSVTPAIGKAMVKAARRDGAISRVHRWGPWTTWHLRGQS